MRWICRVAASLAVCALLGSTVGVESASGWDGTCAGCESYGTYSAPACAAPFYGFQPGCCERPPSPCDNAWDGYCQEKARGRAFVYQVGTGGRAACDGAPSTGCEPTVAIPKAVGHSVPTAPATQLSWPRRPMPPVGLGEPRAPMLPGGQTELPAAMAPDLHVPLPPPPSQFSEPIALPPVTKPVVEETTWRWDYFWRPFGNTPDQRTDWSRLR